MARGLVASGGVAAVQPGLGHTGHMHWCRVLLKDIQPLASHFNHSGLDHGFQDLDVVISCHPEALREEVKGHDISITRHGAQDHNRGRKLCGHHNGNSFRVVSDEAIVLSVTELVLDKFFLI